MKKKIISLLTISTLTMITVFTISSAMADQDTTVKTNHNLTIFGQHGMELKKPTVQPSISDVKAIELASQYAPGAASTAKSITAEYQLFTMKGARMFTEAALEKNANLKKDGFMNDTPVYIVSFEGITKKGHDSINGKEPTVLHEYNIIVDANSGEILSGFGYR